MHVAIFESLYQDYKLIITYVDIRKMIEESNNCAEIVVVIQDVT